MKIIDLIKNLWNLIKIVLLILKIFNIEDLFLNFLEENEINKEKDEEVKINKEKDEEVKINKEKDEYNKEIYRNALMLKVIGAATFICWLKLSKDEIGYVFLALILSEILEKIVEKTK